MASHSFGFGMIVSEGGEILSVLELSDEPTLVDFTVHQLVVQGRQSESLELSGAGALLLCCFGQVNVLLNTLHHVIERLEVIGVHGELGVDVLAHLHDGTSVDGSINLSIGDTKIMRSSKWFILEDFSENASLLLFVVDARCDIEGVGNFCHSETF